MLPVAMMLLMAMPVSTILPTTSLDRRMTAHFLGK